MPRVSKSNEELQNKLAEVQAERDQVLFQHMLDAARIADAMEDAARAFAKIRAILEPKPGEPTAPPSRGTQEP